MPKYLLFILISIFTGNVWPQPDTENSITVVVAKDVYEDYQKFLKLKKQPATAITDFSGIHSRRDVIEIILFIQALHRGGYTGSTSIYRHQNLRRTLRNLARGNYAAWASPLSNDFIYDKVNIIHTDPVTYDGQFEVGLYTLPSSTEVLKIKTLKQLRGFCTVSSKLWDADWKTLSEMRIPCLHSTDQWGLMLKMVKTGRSHLTLAPLQNTPDMVLKTDIVTLVPIPGIKVALKGARSWHVSKLHPQGMATHKYLQKGLKILHSEGIIKQAYTESGAWHTRAKNWKLLNAPATPPYQ